MLASLQAPKGRQHAPNAVGLGAFYDGDAFKAEGASARSALKNNLDFCPSSLRSRVGIGAPRRG